MTGPASTELARAMESQFAERGVAIIEYALTQDDLESMESFFPSLPVRTAGARAHDFTREARAWFAGHSGLQATATRLGAAGEMVMTRLQAFDKSPRANWFVPWHQDRAEDGRERAVDFLENTLALRVHLDACGEDNGPLEVIAGSHICGRLDASAIGRITANATAALCLAERGDIVAMRPLLLHRSQRARRPEARRVIHIEYTSRAVMDACRLHAMAS